MPRLLARSLARIALVVGGLLFAEAALQAVAALSPAARARLSGLKPSYVSDPVLDVRGDPSSAEYDETGFRNAHRPVRATIVVIGDSQTQGSGVARENAWPQQLAQMAGTEVYQMAFGSYGPGHYLHLVDEALTLNPDTIIVAVYTGNDLADVYEWVHEKGRNAELRSTDAASIAALERADRERVAIRDAWEETRDAEKGLVGHPVLRWLRTNVEEKSKIVALYDQLRWRLSGQRATLEVDLAPSRWRDVERITEGVGPETLFPYVDGKLRTVFTPRARLGVLNLEDPRIAEGLRLTLAMLDRIAARTSAAGVDLCVLLIPTKELVFAQRVAEHAPRAPAVFTELGRVEAEARASVKAFLDERSIHWIDPLDALRAALGAQDSLAAAASPYADSWDGHPAPAGHAAIARAVADALAITEARRPSHRGPD